MKKKRAKVVLFLIVVIGFTSCWPTSISFKDGSVPPEWKKFLVHTFENKAPNAPISYSSELTELVKDAVQNRLGLSLVTNEAENPQIIITGNVISYSITPLSLQDNTAEVKNRLTVRCNFEIFIAEPEEDVMQLSSSRFVDFDASQDVGMIQNQLLTEINDQIVQDVLSKLLSNW